MQISLSSTGGKVLASAVLIGAAASVAGLGTFGTFTSTTAASATVASGRCASPSAPAAPPTRCPCPSPAWWPATPSASPSSSPTPVTRTSRRSPSPRWRPPPPGWTPTRSTASSCRSSPVRSVDPGRLRAPRQLHLRIPHHGARVTPRHRRRRTGQPAHLAGRGQRRQPAGQGHAARHGEQRLPGPLQRRRLLLHRHPARRRRPLTAPTASGSRTAPGRCSSHGPGAGGSPDAGVDAPGVAPSV